MVESRNRHGLARHIPSEIKRAVRQRDGFGCIVCGTAIYEYEHVDPEFADAREHAPAGIVLLCPSCHAKKTRGYLAANSIKQAALKPRCRQIGFSFSEFDFGTAHPEVVFGTLRAVNVETLIEIDGEPIISVKPPVETGSPFLLNASLKDADGGSILDIIDNEWQAPSTNWDVETKGGKIVVRRALGEILLLLRVEPPHKMIIERLDMRHRGTSIVCREGQELIFIGSNGSVLRTGGAVITGCRVGVSISANQLAVGVGMGSVSITTLSLNSPSPGRHGRLTRNTLCPCGSGNKYKRCHGRF
jgi:hypothetical protein